MNRVKLQLNAARFSETHRVDALFHILTGKNEKEIRDKIVIATHTQKTRNKRELEQWLKPTIQVFKLKPNRSRALS